MEGIKLAARFSAAPNSLGLCGPKGFDAFDKRRLGAQMRKFRAPYAYLQLIAKANKRNPFDYDVVEAFWLGNSLLDKVKREDVANMIRTKFIGKGRLTNKRAKVLADNLPAQVFPHHSFHVFYIGSISGVLEGKKKELDLCRISWGRVTRVGKSKISVCSKPVAFAGKSANFGHRKNTKWQATDALPKLHNGDTICSHWGVAVVPITAKQQKNLQKYTRINMALYEKRPKRE
jgi:hypothetical protein